ncbi:MAG TPA: restriction endonuclease [Nostocaceae cyanobacterium]|nr:restriction endonuclease [Nostocaceae cyanobacterium]
MSIPDFQTIMLPLLKYASDGKEHTLRETITYLADKFNLTEEERKELLQSGQQTVFDNRVGWSRTYLKKAGLLETPKRGCFKITDRGIEVLKQSPQEINVKFLKQFPEFIQFTTTKKDHDISEDEIMEISETTPQESIEFGYQKIRKELEIELLNRVKTCSPDFFERLVIDLLVKMGYGGSRRDAGKAVGKSGDGGIDGIIKEDKLGLDIVYIQAKRWDNTTVGRPEIQKFAGALQGYRAKKGIFITTSKFSQEARDYVSRIDSKIVLIDGQELAQLMIDNNIGVSTISIYEIKKIDSDYFTDE